MIVTLSHLPVAPEPRPELKLQVTEQDIENYKMWGSAEERYRSVIGTKITINSWQEFESALQDLNKAIYLTEN
jgi:hypothetical protein